MTISEIEVAAGPVRVTRRLALAVTVVDVAGERPAPGGLVAGVETVRAVALARRAARRGLAPRRAAVPLRDHGGGTFVLDYGPTVGARVHVRVEDPSRRFIARRLAVDLRALQDVEATGKDPPGPPVPADYRVLRVGLLPGPAYPRPGGVTGVQVLVTRAGAPVRWARVEALTMTGHVGWGHGDEHGEVQVLGFHHAGIPPNQPVQFPVALRVHVPDPNAPAAGPPALPDDDRLRDLALEPATLPAVPPPPIPPADLDTGLATGLVVPAGYLTRPDQVEMFTVGVVRRLTIAVPS